jgi:hypothetical protein
MSFPIFPPSRRKDRSPGPWTGRTRRTRRGAPLEETSVEETRSEPKKSIHKKVIIHKKKYSLNSKD